MMNFEATYVDARKHAFNLVPWSLCLRSGEGAAWLSALGRAPVGGGNGGRGEERQRERTGPLIHQVFFNWGEKASDRLKMHFAAGRGATLPLEIHVSFKGQVMSSRVAVMDQTIDFTGLCSLPGARGGNSGGWWSVDITVVDAAGRRESRKSQIVCWAN